jgi:hypothetical protein
MMILLQRRMTSCWPLLQIFCYLPAGLGTIPIGIRSENPMEFHWKMF